MKISIFGNQTNNLDDFTEEKENLKAFFRIIDPKIQFYFGNMLRIQAAIDSFFCVDKYDYEEKRALRQSARSYIDEKNKLLGIRDEPYFGRLDLDDGNYYIGKRGYSDGTRQLITDWREPIGAWFYMKNQTSFSIGSITYNLKLRRALKIVCGVLEQCITEYDSSPKTDNLNGESIIMDPFLLSLIQDKHQEQKLTDIILSIQENQNLIIRENFENSFVVQGCAGSGKTMILLHRLSYLLFNNKSLSPESIVIITPNQDFASYINELSTQLGLDRVEKVPLVEYYAKLYRRFVPGTELKLYTPDSNTLSETFIKDIYSKKVIAELNDYCREYFEVARSKVIVQNYQLGALPKSNYSEDYLDLQITVARNVREATTIRANLNDAEKKRELLESEVKNHIRILTITTNIVQQKRQEALNTMFGEISKCEEIIQQGELKEELKVLQSEANARSNIKKHIDYYMTSTDTLATRVRKNCPVIQEILDMQNALADFSPYDYANRKQTENKLRKANSTLIPTIQKSVHSIVEEEKLETQLKIKNATDLKVLLQKAISLLQETTLQQNQRIIKSLGDDYSKVQQWIQPYIDACLEYSTNYNLISAKQKRIDSINRTINELKSKSIPDFEYKSMQSYQDAIDALYYTNIEAVILKKVLTKYYSKHNIQNTARYGQNQHVIYLMLWICTIFHKKPRIVDRMLNIDEGQDISLMEYQLLKTINGDSCVMNIYGDVNQLISKSHGTPIWEELNSIIHNRVFVLKENYRNTKQITEYCNNNFKSDIVPIGIIGKPVIKTSFDVACKTAYEIKKKNTDLRIAIICKLVSEKMRQTIKTYFAYSDLCSISWHRVSKDNGISVLLPVESKGLEFDCVIVTPSGMDINEEYISYTRALDNLIIAS